MKRMTNEYEVRGDHACIFIHYKGVVHECLVDLADLPKLIPYRWKLQKGYKTFYAACNRLCSENQPSLMHRFLARPPKKLKIDHWNHNGLDNRRGNFRIVPHYKNLLNATLSRRNTTGFKGVTFDRNSGKYVAQISVRGKHYTLGYFATPEIAGGIFLAAQQRALRGEEVR